MSQLLAGLDVESVRPGKRTSGPRGLQARLTGFPSPGLLGTEQRVDDAHVRDRILDPVRKLDLPAHGS